MTIKHLLAGSAAVLAFGLASPAMAQVANGVGNGSNGNQQNGNSASTASDNGNFRNNTNNQAASAASGSYTSAFGSSLDFDYRLNSPDIQANQLLIGVNVNHHLDEVVDMDGQDETDTPVGYNSGDNSVNGGAFAAFAGILNQAWNTGINNNVQAGTNIAAQGTVNFNTNSGNTSGATDGGGGGGGGGGD